MSVRPSRERFPLSRLSAAAPASRPGNRLGKGFKPALFLILIAAALAGCAASSQEIWQSLRNRGAAAGFKALVLETPPFALSALLKAPREDASTLVVYIEGDGNILDPRGRVTSDPSPRNPLAYELALLDPAPAVLYLARLGQYLPRYTGDNYKIYWSEGRLSPAAVQAADEAVDQAKARVGAARVCLIGYSGGGGLAVLVAARRDDVAGLISVAALLDHAWWTSANNYRSLSGSLNPIDYAGRVASVPQVHFYGVNDALIAPDMSLRFVRAAPFLDINRVAVAAGHAQGWREAWPGLLQTYVIPLRNR